MAQNTGYEMPEIDINLEGVRAWGGETGPKLPAGQFTMDIVHAEQITSSQKKTPGIEVTFKVADEGEFFGVDLKGQYWLSDSQGSRGRLASLMMACGARLDKLRLGELVGSRIIVTVTHERGQAAVDAQGNTVESDKYFCKVINETAIEAPAPAPTQTRKAAPAPAPAPVTQQGAQTKNGSVARRA